MSCDHRRDWYEPPNPTVGSPGKSTAQRNGACRAKILTGLAKKKHVYLQFLKKKMNQKYFRNLFAIFEKK